jgi:hypothetical protein
MLTPWGQRGSSPSGVLPHTSPGRVTEVVDHQAAQTSRALSPSRREGTGYLRRALDGAS